MSWPVRTWLVLAVVYSAFFGWYTSFAGPLTDDEIAHYTEILRGVSDSPDDMAKWRVFMETDTGDDFAMLNVIEMRDVPTPGPGIESGETSEEVLAKYTAPFLGRALRSAAHPVLIGTAAAPALDVWGIEGAAQWSQGGLVRYRSRRDVLEQVAALAAQSDANIHRYKIAAMEKTIAFPLDPWFQLGDPRLVVGLVLVIVGLSVQLASRPARATASAASGASRA